MRTSGKSIVRNISRGGVHQGMSYELLNIITMEARGFYEAFLAILEVPLTE